MIQAKELRIGNYLQIGLNDDVLRGGYEVLTASCLLDLSANGDKSSFYYEPIPLTEQWLIDLGFNEQLAFSLRTETDSFEVAHNDLDKWYCYFRNINKGEIDDFVQLRTNLKHVHQLQNLYFALTGKELIKQNTP